MTHEKGLDLFRNLLAFFLVSAFVSVLPLLVFKNIPTDNKEIIVYMLGQLSGMAGTAIAFYYTQKAGQDALDVKRSEATGKLADAVTATANTAAANSTTTDTAQAEAADAVADAAVDKAAEIKGES